MSNSGRFLDISLSKGEVSQYEIPDEWTKKYLGGRGMGARILLEEMDEGVEPFGSRNIIVFATGPLQGTGIPGSGRHVVMSKSPKTGGISDSYAGGYFGHELGNSGYDGIIVRGKSKSPKYIVLNKETGKIKEAEDLWGMEIAEVDRELKDRHGNGSVSCIGIGGENLVNFSCIMNDTTRAAGRTGLGAVMGSKNLKAVFVQGGERNSIHNEEKFNELQSEFVGMLEPIIDWGEIGTTVNVMALNQLGILPTKNFQEGSFSNAEKISGEKMYDEFLTERDTCAGCPVRCKRGSFNGEYEGEEIDERYGGPEYETLASFGSLCFNDCLESIAVANEKCNKYGLDTISTGVVISFAMEASEKGLLDKEIDWGDEKAILTLIDKIANRREIGDLLAEGAGEVSDKIGADFAMEVKGQELPMHDPRGKKEQALAYATSHRGPTHLEVTHEAFEEHPAPIRELGLESSVDRLSLESKANYNKVYSDLVSFVNSLIMCWFVSIDSQIIAGKTFFPKIKEILKAVTGFNLDLKDCQKIGERNINLLKILSAREGLSQEDDFLPERFGQPLPEGKSSGAAIDSEKLDKSIREYYELRGWDNRGPTHEKLKELKMDDVTEIAEDIPLRKSNTD